MLKKMVTSEKTVDFKASKVEACRICLNTDIKMYCLQDSSVGSCMESIGGFPKSFEGLPNYVCYECAPVFVKCNKLIEKSKKSQAILFNIFTKNKQINKPLIKKQAELHKLQPKLDSYLKLNYYYIKYDDDNNTSVCTKIESDPTNIKTKLKKEMKEESSDEESESEIVEIADSSEMEEQDSDGDVEEIEKDIPVVEISDDDEQCSDDFISLKPYTVEQNTEISGLLADTSDMPLYYLKRISGVRKSKKEKKRGRKRKYEESLTSSILIHETLKKYFNVIVIPRPTKREKTIYSCKSCPESFRHKDEASNHALLFCHRNSSRNFN